MSNIVLSIYNYDDKTAKQQLNLTKYQHGFLQNFELSNEIKFEKSKRVTQLNGIDYWIL